MTTRSFQSLPPIETLDLGNALSLLPRLKLLLTIFRSDPSVKPIDEWQLKRSLIDFLKTSLSISLSAPEEDLLLHRSKDLKKRKREDPVASGTLYIRDLGFLKNSNKKKSNYETDDGVDDDDVKIVEKKYFEWRNSVVDRMDGIDLNLEGVKFRLSVAVPESDDFDGLKRSWEDLYASGYYSRGLRQRPDTVVVKGVPSRWFAEPRVSSKPSMLVTHTIFSVFGKIRNLNVAGDDDLGKIAEEANRDIVSGLHCTIRVQFEKYEDFYNTLKLLCGRSMQKQGSRLKADYEVTWDRESFFRNTQQKDARIQIEEKRSRMQVTEGHYRSEAPRLQQQVTRSKRLRNDGWDGNFKRIG